MGENGRMRTLGLIALGGAIGATIRLIVNELLPIATGEFPWATLLVNVLGCAGIGWAAGHWAHTDARWRFGVTGVLGGLTTASTFAVEARGLLATDHLALAAAYVGASVLGGSFALELARAARPPHVDRATS